MVQIGYILLCHRDPQAIIAQAKRLTAVGDCVSIHFDARASRDHYNLLRKELDPIENVTFARKRLKCGWGEWSLVAATIEAAQAALEDFPDATHFYMLSGDCMPVKSAEFAHAMLAAENVDYIESEDFFESGWIKTGFCEERLIYRHYFNERVQKRLFYTSFNLQKRLGITRRVPEDIQMMIGSQWWCLRRRTLEAVMSFCKERPEILRFFSTTWIPDETFFQTLVRHLVPREELRSRTLTFLMFSDYGMPVTFYNDHYDLIVGHDALFARKISPEAKELKQRLGRLYAAEGESFEISGEGRRLYKFLADRGREGQRYAPRFWENSGRLARSQELMIVVCKKWHVAKRLTEAVRHQTDLPALDYVFSEEDTEMPDLGGIERGLEKRMRHCRVLTKMLFEGLNSDRLVLCMDPSMLDLLRDFEDNPSVTRVLEIDCDMDDDWLMGHAQRVGLAADHPTPEARIQILPAVRNDVYGEFERIRDAGFANMFTIRQNASAEENAVSLAEFLSIPEDTAREIAATDHLFSD